MKVVFRVDASDLIGTGHVFRCLTLAKEIRKRGGDCEFVSRSHPGNLNALIKNEGFFLHELPFRGTKKNGDIQQYDETSYSVWLGEDWQIDAFLTKSLLVNSRVDWLVIDHYSIDEKWESFVRTSCEQILVIDDLANRVHDCDLLLDQNLIKNFDDRYKKKTPYFCGLLLGPTYALLQPEYLKYRRYTIPRKGKISNILIYFGGCDNQNLTGKSIQAILTLKAEGLHIDVVISPLSSFKENIYSLINGRPEFTLYDNGLPSLAPLMAKADVSLGGSGTTSWERCCLGLPSLAIALADNQKQIAYELDRLGYIRWLGDASNIHISNISSALKDIMFSGLNVEWSRRCSSLIDGHGVSRVLERMGISAPTNLHARRASLQDEGLILNWANDALVRKNAFTSELIDSLSHAKWYRDKLDDIYRCRIFIVEDQRKNSIGYVRFEKELDSWEIHYSVNSKFRGQGLARFMLKVTLDTFFSELGSYDVFGRVKKDNLTSQKIFLALGFSEVQNQSEFIYKKVIN